MATHFRGLRTVGKRDDRSFRVVQLPIKELLLLALVVGAGWLWWSFRQQASGGEGQAAGVATTEAESALAKVTGSRLPTSVFGGDRQVKLWAILSHRGRVQTAFERDEAGADGQKLVERAQELPSGEHTFIIAVPDQTSGFVDVCIDSPPLKATVEVTIEGHNGRTLGDEQELTEPLADGEMFCAKLEFADWASATPSD